MTLKSDFERDGVVVVRHAIPMTFIERWVRFWENHRDVERVPGFNPVEVNEPKFVLDHIAHNPILLNHVEEIFGPDIALYNARFVVKDKHARGPVFLHQDTGYHVGWPRKLSAFVPLTPCSPENGGMKFWPGTHRYGYLGDAGEIAQRHHLGQYIIPIIYPGDVVLMHSACWHGSHDHLRGPDRVMADIIYQPADDPSGRELLRGEWKCTPAPWLHDGNLFVRSRVSRLKELQEQVDREKA